jgi:hypothetical protein
VRKTENRSRFGIKWKNIKLSRTLGEDTGEDDSTWMRRQI